MSNWLDRTVTNEKLYQKLKNIVICNDKICISCCFIGNIYETEGLCKLFGVIKRDSSSIFRHEECKKIFKEHI